MVYESFDLQGKVAVVVGGTSGIGRMIGRGLAQAGADVIPTGRRKDLVDEVATEIESLGRRSLRVTCDVEQRSSLGAVLEAALKSFGRMDILVYAAGVTDRGPFLKVSEEAWHKVIETNLTGAFRACQIFGTHMVKRGYGRIITIGSLGSYLGLNEVAAYAASKGALVSLTRTLAVEWAKSGVCVNAIVPGVFPTALNRKLLDGTPRPGVSDSHSHEQIRKSRGTDGRRGFSRLRCGKLRYWYDFEHRWRISGQRRESIA